MKRLALFAALALLLTLAAACGASASGASVSAPTMPAEVATPAAPTPAGPTPIQAADPVWTFDGGATPFNTPLALAIDTRDHLYVTDSRNGRVVKLDADGHVLGQWGSPGDRPGQFSRLLGVAADAQGNVYVTDGGEHMRVQKFDSDGRFLAQWGGYGKREGQFAVPTYIAVDSRGQVFVVDKNNFRVQKFDGQGAFLGAWGGFGSADGQFSRMGAVAIDPQGNVYVSDDLSHRISKFDNDGRFLGKWAFGDLSCAFPRASKGPAELAEPLGMAFDQRGQLFVADSWARICTYDRSGAFMGGWGDQGAQAGQLNRPGGVVADRSGSVYVLDYANNRVQKFQVR